MAKSRHEAIEDKIEAEHQAQRLLQDAFDNGDLETHVEIPELTSEQHFAIMVTAMKIAEAVEQRMKHTLGRVD